MTASFSSAFLSCFATIVASELGDKTFFIAAILAMAHSRLQVFVGCFAALFIMNTLSAAFGSLAPALIPVHWTTVASIALFFLTGILNLRDALTPSRLSSGSEELADAETECSRADGSKWPRRFAFVHPTVVEAFALTFLAEWGDKSQLVTLGLGATQHLSGVILGGGAGHALCTCAAVAGGKQLAARCDERLIAALSGTLFLTFALISALSSASALS